MITTAAMQVDDAERARAILEDAGRRGASHEDFVEAGLARDYPAALRQLVEDEGLGLRVDYTTGTARWILTGRQAVRRAA